MATYIINGANIQVYKDGVLQTSGLKTYHCGEYTFSAASTDNNSYGTRQVVRFSATYASTTLFSYNDQCRVFFLPFITASLLANGLSTYTDRIEVDVLESASSPVIATFSTRYNYSESYALKGYNLGFDITDAINSVGNKSIYIKLRIYTTTTFNYFNEKTYFSFIITPINGYDTTAQIQNAANFSLSLKEDNSVTEIKNINLFETSSVKEFDVNATSSYTLSLDISNINPGLTFGFTEFSFYAPCLSFNNSTFLDYVQTTANPSEVVISPIMLLTGCSKETPIYIQAYISFQGTPDPNWNPNPPVDPDPPTPPDSKTDYLVYVSSGALGYAPSGHLALA